MPQEGRLAPGAPGIPPRWTTSAKSGVGTSLTRGSRVWFTVSHGILNEIYYPRIDLACVRDMGLIVTSGSDFFSEEKRHTTHRISWAQDGVPAFRIENTCERGRYRIEKLILTDPGRDVVLQKTRFTPLSGSRSEYRLYALLASHLGNRGTGNTAWIGDFKGIPMLFAEREGNALALACSVPWLNRSVGYVGASDGWQDLSQNRRMTWFYDRAENGNVALTGEVDLDAGGGEMVFLIGFGRTPAEAGQRARASLLEGFEASEKEYVRSWKEWQASLLDLNSGTQDRCDRYRASTAVIRSHEEKRFPGGLIASLSVPWGASKGDDDLGGYHLVWPRDLVETAGGFLAAGASEDARRVIDYLQVTQEADGHWAQNMWLDGTPYWTGVQIDETAFPVLLVDLARRERVLTLPEVGRIWPMVRRAAAFIVQNGPVTQQDRWEEDPGYSPFTLAVEIAALLAAADLADLNGEGTVARYLRETADTWNACIEHWTFVSGTDLAAELGIEGYYVRIAPPEVAEAASVVDGFVPIKNRPPGRSPEPASRIVSPDALALVRFGLRPPNDPRIVSTIKAIDWLLKVDTPAGPAWRRYNEDGYGEHDDGAPFDGTGTGRAWPLLTGERAHFELAAANISTAKALLRALEGFANESGLISEQIWDSADIPRYELFRGRPTGSAMPLVWAHAEYIKLRRSLRDGRVFDMPPQTAERYIVDRHASPYVVWRFNHKSQMIPKGKILRIETLRSATIHWSDDEWRTVHDTPTKDTGLGVACADLSVERLPQGRTIRFTFFWTQPGKWEGTDFSARIVGAE